MPVVISEIITEAVVSPRAQSSAGDVPATLQPDLDLVVRRAVERVLEVLRQEWDR